MLNSENLHQYRNVVSAMFTVEDVQELVDKLNAAGFWDPSAASRHPVAYATLLNLMSEPLPRIGKINEMRTLLRLPPVTVADIITFFPEPRRDDDDYVFFPFEEFVPWMEVTWWQRYRMVSQLMNELTDQQWEAFHTYMRAVFDDEDGTKYEFGMAPMALAGSEVPAMWVQHIPTANEDGWRIDEKGNYYLVSN